MDHKCLLEFRKHRIADRRVLRLIGEAESQGFGERVVGDEAKCASFAAPTTASRLVLSEKSLVMRQVNRCPTRCAQWANIWKPHMMVLRQQAN